MAIRNLFREKRNIFHMVGIIVIFIVFSLYMYPYFINEMRKSFSIVYYFSTPSLEYLNGIFPWASNWVDLTLSWTALAGAKLLYFCGLRPTYGDTGLGLVILRSAAGLLLLPGLIHAAFVMPRRQKLFVALFCLPIFMGPTQDRYNLPVFPILFLYGALAYETYARKARQIWSRALGAPKISS